MASLRVALALGGMLVSLVIHALSLVGTPFGPGVWSIYFGALALYLVMASRVKVDPRRTDFLLRKGPRNVFFRPMPTWTKRVLVATFLYSCLHLARFVVLDAQGHEPRGFDGDRVIWASSFCISMYWLMYLSFRYHRGGERSLGDE